VSQWAPASEQLHLPPANVADSVFPERIMLVFARFVLRDNGLPIHIATEHVTQVRLTIDGEPAIYILNKETPVIVEGTLEAAVRKLEAAASGLRLVEPEPAPNVIPWETPAANEPAPAPEPEPKSMVVMAAAKPSAKAKKATAKPSPKEAGASKTVSVTASKAQNKSKAKPSQVTARVEDAADDDLNWFKGLGPS
jgi:hypothetical protein